MSKLSTLNTPQELEYDKWFRKIEGILEDLSVEEMPYVHEDEGGSFNIYFTKKSARLGVCIEKESADSGWYFVCKKGNHIHQECGGLNDGSLTDEKLKACLKHIHHSQVH